MKSNDPSENKDVFSPSLTRVSWHREKDGKFRNKSLLCIRENVADMPKHSYF